ncbi:Protein transport protein [Schistosoma japonicum]|uniref:Protein transport protein n=1 Tax=Schistosoma japonicum TaxID=6182 RepID=A0A4Z2D207_SCHJA|nr:Protein transport protein [Schistosoma japonicum]
MYGRDQTGNVMKNVNSEDLLGNNPLTQQHPSDNGKKISHISQRSTAMVEGVYQHPVHSNTFNAIEGCYSNESSQDLISSSGSLTPLSGSQLRQVISSTPQFVSAAPLVHDVNGPTITASITNLPRMHINKPTSEGYLHQPQLYDMDSRLHPVPTTDVSNSPQLNNLYTPTSISSYSNFNACGQHNSPPYDPLQPSVQERDRTMTLQGAPISASGYVGYSQISNSEYRSSLPLTQGDHPTPKFTNTQTVPQFYGEQCPQPSPNPQFNSLTSLLPPNPKTLTPRQNMPPSMAVYDMNHSVKSYLYPPCVTNDSLPASVRSHEMTTSPPALSMSSNTYQNYYQQPLPRPGNILQSTIPRHTACEQSSVFRTPGTATSVSDWNSLKTPINLLQEHCLLPSDGPDMPPKPALTTPINCDQDVMRCTLTNVPSTSKLLTQCRLPLGLVMHPFRDMSSLHTISPTAIVRCRSCRTYINPFVQFMDSGRRWRCSVCFLVNTVPDEFCYDPGTQTYGDPSRRPEIRSATVEFIAPSEYTVRPPQPATYLFCFDVSHNAISTGYLQLACRCLEGLIGRIPGDCRRQIAFMTFNSSVHYYKLCGETIRMLICPDLEEIFLPDDEGLINRIEDSADVLREFLLHLPENFIGTNDTGNCLGSALQAALKLIGVVGGRITVFTTCLPTVGAGALSLREEPSDRSSVDVKHLGPSTDFYKTFALDCSHKQVGVDMFIFNSQYCDIATISGASRYSSGTIHHYPDFCYIPDGDIKTPIHTNAKIINTELNDLSKQQTTVCVGVEQFRRDFERYLTRKLGFEAVMRIRCTYGLGIQTFHGSCFVRSTDLIALPNVSPDSGYAVQLDLSESLEKYHSVCCQAAILYTSSRGDRRIRVHTLCLPVVHTETEVFQGADQGAIACLLSKMAVDRTISLGLSNAREALANAVADALSAYATTSGISLNCNSTAYGLPCPPNLRLLPLYICGLLRFKAFRVGVVTRLDDRSAALERIKCAPPDDLLTLIYPKLYAVHRLVSKPLSSHATLAQKAASLRLVDHSDDERPSECDGTSSSGSDNNLEADQLPCQLHLSAQYITRSGIFLLDTGELLLLLVGCGEDISPGSQADSEILRQLLNISSPNELPPQGGPFSLPSINSSNEKQNALINDTSSIPISRRRLSALINLIRRRRPINNALVLMRHDAPPNLRSLFLSCMIEDKTESAPSYQEFLQMIQNLVRT